MFTSLAIVTVLKAIVLLPIVYTTDRPPKEVSRLIEQLIGRGGAAQDIAVDHLARLPAAEPYLQRLLASPDPIIRRKASLALTSVRDLACEHALTRHATEWAKAGRVDMLVELACLTRIEKLAGRVVDLVLKATTDKLSPNMTLPLPDGQDKLLQFPADSYAEWSRRSRFLRVTDGELMTGSYVGNVFAHSLTFKTNVGSDRSFWICLIGDRLIETTPRPRDWWRSIIAVNNNAAFENIFNTIVVIDGDIDMKSRFGLVEAHRSVVVCRGSIRSKQRVLSTGSLFVAGGDVTINGSCGGPDTLVYAGGRVAVEKGRNGKPTIKEKADVSFTGIRFFELADIGVNATADKDGVHITKLDPRSPLTRYGLRVGDVVNKLNDQPMTSVNEFRRHARRSVVLRAGIFSLHRGDETLSRIVYFDGLLDPSPPVAK